MKYTKENQPIKCFMRQSTWYKGSGKTTVKGVLFHSTGANNPMLKRYVQPDDNATDREKMIELLGENKGKSDWNHTYIEAGVHAFIGKLDNGEVATVQVGDWDKKAWGCGSGKKGSCNNGWIQFEICEDNLKDPVYFEKVYREAIELTAYLCKMYNLDPNGTVVFNRVNVPVILCHQDSYQLGLGSNHADVLHWFSKYGKSMQTVRNDVSNLLREDDEDMTGEEIYNRLAEYLSSQPAPDWAKKEYKEAVDRGITDGTRPMMFTTRLETSIMAKRAVENK